MASDVCGDHELRAGLLAASELAAPVLLAMHRPSGGSDRIALAPTLQTIGVLLELNARKEGGCQKRYYKDIKIQETVNGNLEKRKKCLFYLQILLYATL